MYNQRDVVLLPFPYSDLTGAKHRPALIISNKNINRSEDRICCLITSNPASDGVLMDKGCFEHGELPFQSWVKPHRLFTIHKMIIKRKLCTVTRAFHGRIISSINEHLNTD